MMYIVTGRHRTGTSMMMQALSKCIDPVFDMNFEQEIRSRELNSEYNPNPNGYWNSKTLPHDHDNCLIKCNVHLWPMVNAGDYKVVWMVREESLRKTSMQRSFGDDYGMTHFYEMGEQLLELINPIKMEYDWVVTNPLEAFNVLKSNGWPIDPEVCAKEVDQDLWRNR